MAVPAIAITMGDPAGVGPEIIVKACRALAPRLAEGSLRLTVLGSAAALHRAEAVLGHTLPAAESTLGRSAGSRDGEAPLALVDVDPQTPEVPVGQVSAAGGHYAFLAVKAGVDLALAGQVDAIVTAPLNKEALNRAGHAYAGHTDMLADLTGVTGSVMMLAHDGMRVSHVSTHVPLSAVPGLLTPKRLRRVIDLTAEALVELGIARPRIAVAALNPHAGEGGIFGREDIEVTTPIVDDYRARGHAVEGPVPGDTVFVKLRGGRYDAVVAMYHDQGHIPVKLLGFRTDPETGAWQALNGVNVTLGLPIIRTSVDHGTAFDIAGTGAANEESLIEAIDYALTMAANRRRRAAGGEARRA